MLYVGTLIALFIICGKDLLKLMQETAGIASDCIANLWTFINKKIGETSHRYKRVINSPYRKFAVLVIVSMVPTVIVNIICRQLIESASKSFLIIGVALLMSGTVSLISDALPKGSKTPKHVTYMNGILVGICQSMGLLQGISDLSATYCMGIYCGFRRDFAVKYSMVLLAPVSVVNILIGLSEWRPDGVDMVGIFVAMASLFGATILCFICIRILQLIMQKNKIKYFAYFCYGMGIIAIIVQFANIIAA